MAYSLYIERNNSEITLDEWIAAINQISSVRLDNDDSTAKNPKTDEKITIRGNAGDASILFESSGFIGFGKKSEWVKVFSFRRGKASFNSSHDIESPKNPTHIAAAALAKYLNAQIVGDEGETYEW
jgi:hypothetical protein